MQNQKFVVTALVLAAALAPAQWKPKDTEWPSYNADTMGRVIARSIRSTRRISASWKSPGDSRPIPSATARSTSWKARR